MGKEMLFSIIVPVYNVEDYIEECVQSVLAQTYSNYEIILVDDGSTDTSGMICDRFAEQDSRIHTYHKENEGQIHTRITAMEHASGDYIVMLDSDDLLEINALEILHNAINRHHCDCVLFNRKRLINNNIINPSYRIQEDYVTDKRIALRKALIEIPYNAIVLKCAKSFMYKSMDYTKYYHIRHGEDLLQSLELLHNCNTFEFIDDAIYIYRMRAGSITQTVEEQDPPDFTVRKSVLDYIRTENVFKTEDYNDYRDKCINLFVDQINRTGASGISYKKKKQIFEKIRSEDYYTGFISKGISDRKRFTHSKMIVFHLFTKRKDTVLIYVLAGYKMITGLLKRHNKS